MGCFEGHYSLSVREKRFSAWVADLPQAPLTLDNLSLGSVIGVIIGDAIIPIKDC